jgi:NADH:ubiquinone oxidoreductase subunit 6 (subunit J)
MLEKIIFIILSVITLGSGLVVVIERNLFRAALYLVAALFGVAGMFVLLEAGFLAVVQVFIYAGAIAILIIFAVMLTRRVMNPDTPQVNSQSAASVALAIVLFALLALVLAPDQLQIGDLTLGGIVWPERADQTPVDITDLGRALVDAEQYVVPFEVASVLLLVAMIGAVYIVFPRRGAAPPGAEAVADTASVPAGDAGETGVEE